MLLPAFRSMPVFPRLHLLVAAFLATASLPAHAAWQPISEAPLAGEVEFQCRFGRDNSTECVNTYRYTILTLAGRDMVSRIDRSFPENDSVTIEQAAVIQPGEQPVPLLPEQIDTRMAPNPAMGFLRMKQTSMAFPNLRIGSTVVYTIREHRAGTPHATQFHYRLSLPPQAVRQDRFRAEFSADRPMVWRAEAMDAYRIEASPDARHITVELKAAPHYYALVGEPQMGHLRQYPRLEVGSSAELQDYFGPFVTQYNDIVSKPLPTAAAEAVAAQAGKDPEQVVAALMRHIHERYRYLGDWRSSERGYIPFALDEIESRGYGDCKDFTVLLAAMLRASGIAAEPALVMRGSVVPNLLLPGLLAPNHAVVRAEVQGKTWWLDPTNPVFVPGFTMPDIQQRWALVMDTQGQMRREDIPLEGPTTGGAAVTQRALFRKDGLADVTASSEISPMMAAHLGISDQKRGHTVTDQRLCASFALENRDCHVQRADSDFLIPPTYRVDAALVDLRPLERAGSALVHKPHPGRVWEFFARYRQTDQVTDIYMGSPETKSLDMTLAGGKVNAPPLHCQVRSPWIDVDVDGKRMGQDYQYQYRSVRKVAWFSHADITSAAFGRAIEQGRKCAESLRMAVKLPTK